MQASSQSRSASPPWFRPSRHSLQTTKCLTRPDGHSRIRTVGPVEKRREKGSAMCDTATAADNTQHLAEMMTRGGFGAATAALGVAALLRGPAHAAKVNGRDVSITTADGLCDAYFVAPATGTHPGVIVWPDIF